MKRRLTAYIIALSCLFTQTAAAISPSASQDFTVYDNQKNIRLSQSTSSGEYPGSYFAQLKDDPIAEEAYKSIESALSSDSFTMSGSVITIEYSSKLDTVVGVSQSDSVQSSGAFKAMLTDSGYFSAIKDAFAAYRRDHPEAFYLSGSLSQTASQGERIALSGGGYGCTVGKVTLKLSTLFSGRTALRSAKTRFDSALNSAVSYAKTGSSRYQRLRYAHDYLCGSAQYEYDTFSSSAYGALITGSSMCEGYAQAFKLICDKLNIPCVEVSGSSYNKNGYQSHIWNAVQMDNGQWYAADVTWDDMDSDEIQDHHTFFLVGSETTAKTYYNMGSFSSTHIENGYLYNDTNTRCFVYPQISPNRYWAAVRMEVTPSLIMEAGSKKQLEASIYADPSVSADPTIVTVDASSSNNSVAFVDSKTGVVSALSAGSAVITLKHADGLSKSCNVTVMNISSLSLPSHIDLAQHTQQTLKPDIKPAELSDAKLSWHSSNDEIVSVDENGTITGKQNGDAVITVSSANGITASISVSVSYISASSVSVTPAQANLSVGDSLKLKAEIMPASVSSSNIKWVSDNPNIVSVSEDGTVSALASGSARITAVSGNIVSNQCVITAVSVPAETMTLSKSSLSLVSGASETLSAYILPEKTTDKTVKWQSDNPSAVSVDESGTVTAHSSGNAVITASCGQASAKCSVSVLAGTDKPQLIGISNTADGVNITWKALPYAEGYSIARKSGSEWVDIGAVSSDKNSYTDSSVQSGKSYTYTVFPISGGKKLDVCDESGLKITFLSTPKLNAIENKRQGLSISWRKLSGIKGVRIYRRSAGDNDWTLLSTVSGSYAKSYIDSTAANHHVYAYTVEAFSGEYSSGKDSKGLALRRVTSPSITHAKNISVRSVNLKWNKVGYTDGYQLEYSLSSGFSKSSTADFSPNNNTGTILSGLKRGKTYYIRVRSYKVTGKSGIYSDWSSIKSVKIKK